MTKDLGVWTDENSALVLIDYQKEMFETIRSETTAQLAELHVRLLARIAKALEMPIVLSTVGVNYKINSPTQPAILADLPGVTALDRTSMNAFEDRAFVDALKKTGRKRLIVGGLHTEICLTFAMIEALKAGTAYHLSETPAARKGEKLRISIKMSGIVPNGNSSEGAVLTLRDTTAEIVLHAKYHKSMSLLEENREKLAETEDKLSALRRSLRNVVGR